MRRLVPFLLLWSLSASAQTVEYEIPTAFELVPGRLAVTFGEAVPLQRAQSLMDSLRLPIVESNFRPVRATLRFEAPPTPGQQDLLTTDPLITAVIPITKGTFASGVFEVVLAPHATPEDADRAAQRAGALPVDHVEKLPNEIVVETAEGAEEETLLRLEQLQEVRYVSYIHLAQ